MHSICQITRFFSTTSIESGRRPPFLFSSPFSSPLFGGLGIMMSPPEPQPEALEAPAAPRARSRPPRLRRSLTARPVEHEFHNALRVLPQAMRVIRRRSSHVTDNRGQDAALEPEQPNVGSSRRNRRVPKSIGASGNLKKLAVKEEIIRGLECPVCYNIPIPPIYNCKGGHLTCGPCRSKLDKCGLCKKPFSSGRNYPLEAIVNACYFHCAYDDDGCTAEIKGEVYCHHTSTCDFRNVICTETRKQICDFVSIPYRMYWNHLQEVHKLRSKVVSFSDYCTVNLSIPTSTGGGISDCKDKHCIEIANTDHKFIVRVLHCSKNFKFWICYVGGVEEASNFKATMSIGSVFARESKVSWTMSIPSFRKDITELEEVGTVMDSYMKKIAKNVEDGVYKILLYCKIDKVVSG